MQILCHSTHRRFAYDKRIKKNLNDQDAQYASIFYYWNDPRIHELGNGKVSAFFARTATKFINTFSYRGRNIRDEILTKMIDNHDSVLDMCCGTGTSTPYKTELNQQVLGIDTSKAMITEARWRRGPNGLFEIANAEKFW